MFCSVKTNEGNDGSASSLSQVTYYTFARIPPQIHAARFSNQ